MTGEITEKIGGEISEEDDEDEATFCLCSRRYTSQLFKRMNISKHLLQLLILSTGLLFLLQQDFTALQAYEYIEASFTIADSVYGSTFFVATGFHGLHVIIGTRFLAVCLYRLYICHFSANHHFGFEAAA